MKNIIFLILCLLFISCLSDLERKNPADPKAGEYFLGPKVKIRNPKDGEIIENVNYISFLGEAFSKDGEFIYDNEAFEWYSDINGFLGSGMSLYGNFTIDPNDKKKIYLENNREHTITLKVTDSNGYINYDQIKIIIDVR